MSLCSCCSFTRPELITLAAQLELATDAVVSPADRITFSAADGTVLAAGLCKWTTIVLLRCGGDEELARVLFQAGDL